MRCRRLALLIACLAAGCTQAPSNPACVALPHPGQAEVQTNGGTTLVGHPFNPNAVARLQPGVTTEKDAVAALGQPWSGKIYVDGRQMLQWTFITGQPGGGAGAEVAIFFNAGCTMTKVGYFWRQPAGGTAIPGH